MVLGATLCRKLVAVCASCLVILGGLVLADSGPAGTAIAEAVPNPRASTGPEDYHPSPQNVGQPFDCGYNNKVPFPNNKGCVWVETNRYVWNRNLPDPRLVRAYCPGPGASTFNFPFQVLLGNDPLWQDLSVRGSSAAIRPVSFTYHRNQGNFWWSWAGQPFVQVPRQDKRAGYVSVQFNLYRNTRNGSYAQIRYVCTNQFTSRADP